MKIYKNLKIKKSHKNSVIAIGNFDGIHLGHQKVINQAKKKAKIYNMPFGLITFEPMPVMFFNQKVRNHRINSLNQKILQLKKMELDFMIIIKFNRLFSFLSPYQFIRKIIFKKANSKCIFVSKNFKFGKNRRGDVRLLKRYGSNYGYQLLNIKPFKHFKKVVSSTKIRKYLMRGEVELANRLLSRTWFIQGKVIAGRKIGRKLGYRTCNINVKDYILPKVGIYIVKVAINLKTKIYGGVAYLGSRPTFNGKNIFLEINIFGINENLYNKKLKVYFLKFLRGDRKFSSSNQLIRQMNKDVIFAKKGLKAKLVL